MKKTCFACLLTLLLAACGGKQALHTTELSVELKGAADDTLYLCGTDGLYDRIDTLPLKNGKLSTTLTLDTLIMADLLLPDGRQYPVFLGKGEKIRLKGTADGNLEVSGSLPNEELTAFYKGLRESPDGTKTEPLTFAQERVKAEQFILDHQASLASVALLQKYFVQQPNPDYKLITRLTERMTGDLKDRAPLSTLLESLKDEEKISVGRVAPYLQMNNAKGEKVTRNTFKGKYLLLHFWASWDTESREANAALRRIYKKEKKNEYFALLGVSLDLDRQTWLDCIKSDTLQWEQLCDFQGWEGNTVKQFCLHRLPTNLLLDTGGKIQGINLTEEELLTKIPEIEKREKEKAQREKERKSAQKSKKRK